MSTPRRGRGNGGGGNGLSGGRVMQSPGELDRLAAQLEEEEKEEEGPSPQRAAALMCGGISPATTTFTAEETAAAAYAAADVLNGTPGESTNPPPLRHDPSPPGTTTARKKKKKKIQTKIKIGCRVYSTRKTLWNVGLISEGQKAVIHDYPQSFRLYGTAKSGKGCSGYNVEYDLFPAGDKMVKGLNRKRLVVMKKGEQEKEMPSSLEQLAEIEEEKAREEAKKDTLTKSVEEFLALPKDEIARASIYAMRYGKEPDETVDWDILGDGVHITEDEMTIPETLEMSTNIDYGPDYNLAEVFFKHFFPVLEGHGKLLDEFHSDRRSPYYTTVKNDNISFHDESDEDPDWIVKQCYLLMIAAVTEAQVGVENLWKRGQSGGRHPHANFGQYVPQNTFKAFLAAAALVFADKKWWFTEKRDRQWDIFHPLLNMYNDKRRRLFEVVLLILDESMSGWRPKNSKEGGLPFIMHEPRKPVDLGTQLRNACECLSGVLVFQDVVQASEQQRLKDFYYSNNNTMETHKTDLPRRPEITAHAAEVLRQAQGSGIREGGWIGGDAWFGSVMSCVELKTKFNVFSTFIVKGNKYLYPMEILHAVLRSRHGTRPAGHWVVMTTTICEVKLIAMAYAWSQKGVSYFISTCGKTCPSPHLYEAKCEDEWGNTNFRQVPRPDIVHFLYEYLPLIDEHNKQRQSLLQLEKRWLTQCCWFRLLTTMLGMCVVDFHRHCRYNQIKISGQKQEDIDTLGVIHFSDLICGSLRPWKYKTNRRAIQGSEVENLERIRDSEGRTNLPPTEWQKNERGNTIGNPIRHCCFVCRKYKPKDKPTTYRPTSFWCKTCHMPICKESQKGKDGGRELSCAEEHFCTEDPLLGCNEHVMFKKKTQFPKEKMVDLWPRRSKRQRTS